MIELLRNNIAKHLPLSEAELQQFYDLFEHKDFKRKSYFYRT